MQCGGAVEGDGSRPVKLSDRLTVQAAASSWNATGLMHPTWKGRPTKEQNEHTGELFTWPQGGEEISKHTSKPDTAEGENEYS